MEKKRKYLDSYLQQRHHFSPFVVLVSDLLVTEAEYTLKRLASRIATNCRQPYSCTCRCFRSRVAIAILRDTCCCMWGSQVPVIRISVQRPQWEYGDGLYIYR